MHQASAALRFMHGSDASVSQAVDHIGVGAFNTGYYD
jgi:hypothetical protein